MVVWKCEGSGWGLKGLQRGTRKLLEMINILVIFAVVMISGYIHMSKLKLTLRMCNITEYYVAVRGNKLWICAMIWMNLKKHYTQ